MTQLSIWKPNQPIACHRTLAPGITPLPGNPWPARLSDKHENAARELICTAIYARFTHFTSMAAIIELGAPTHLSIAIPAREFI
ncbi:hypothetical protein G3N95_30430 [Paraburkholderia sp. Tr-20389]|uniref:hypothetical protein n=1 Tax=Paraburkholderia sp. Tr-20389 TaxID=2703903 RepID=UPI00197EF1EF|nr:hypothetical protein [Paraburkholderia sp. Tr-20389]MBN3757289.1 hypothetical protein [Paraburkholderia sp. Tr-20389]